MSFNKNISHYFIILFVVFLFLVSASVVKADNNYSFNDKIEDINLIEYHLQIVRIDESDWERLGLKDLKLELDMQDVFSLITAGSLLEIAGVGSRALIQFEAYQAEEIIRTESRPVLITELKQPVSFKISEEVIALEEPLSGSNLKHDQLMYLSLLPERMDENGRVLTVLKFNTGDTSSVETSFWSVSDEMQLVGIITWNRSTEAIEALSKGSRTDKTTFALYLTHKLIYVGEERDSNIMTMDGLNRLFWSQPTKISNYPGYIEILSPPEIDLLLMNHYRRLAVELNIRNILQPVVFIGLDGIAYEDLRLGFRVIRNRDKISRDLEFAPVFNERVFFEPFVEISAAYYPFFYNMSKAEINMESAYYLGLTLKYRPLSARLKYSSNLGSSELQLLLGYDLNNSITILAGVDGSREAVDRFIAGLRINF